MVVFDFGNSTDNPPCRGSACRPPRVGFACAGACTAEARDNGGSGWSSGAIFGTVFLVFAGAAAMLWLRNDCLARRRRRDLHRVAQGGLSAPLVHPEARLVTNPAAPLEEHDRAFQRALHMSRVEQRVERLCAMGFGRAQSAAALERSGGDVSQAASMLARTASKPSSATEL